MWNLKTLIQPLNSFVDALFDEDNISATEACLWLREYLTAHPRNSDDEIVVDPEQRQKVALICVQVLNGALSKPIVGTGFMQDTSRPTIPEIPPDSELPAEVWYACRFWLDHVLDIGTTYPSMLFMTALRKLLTTHMRSWMEVMISRRRFRRLTGLREWISNSYRQDETIQLALYSGYLAIRLHKVAFTLSQSGRNAEAVEITLEAVEICKGLMLRKPDRVAVQAAVQVSLASLSGHLSRNGRGDEAVEAARQAIAIARKLLSKDPPALKQFVLPSLLSFLSLPLCDVHRFDVSLEFAQEAVDILRKMEDKESQEYLRYLTDSLTTLCSSFSATGRDLEALVLIKEAVEISKTKLDPPDISLLIEAQGMLAQTLMKVNQWEEALETSEEVFRLPHTTTNPADPKLTLQLLDTLDYITLIFTVFHRRREVTQLSEEASRIILDLPEEQQSSVILQRRSARARVRQLRYALYDESTSVELRQLCKRLKSIESNAAVADNLGATLTLVDCFAALGRRDEALVAAKESLVICEQFLEGRVKVWKQMICLQACSTAFSRLGQRDASLETIQRAVDLIEPSSALVEMNAASILDFYAMRLGEVGRKDEALVNAERALEMWKKLAMNQELVIRENFARSLHSLSNRLSELDGKEEALSAIQKAVSLYRVLVTGEFPEDFIIPFVASLNDLAALLGDVSRDEEALSVLAEALDLLDGPSSSSLSTKQEIRAESLNQLALRLHALSRAEEAVTEARKSVDLYRELAKTYPAAFNHLLAKSLHTLFVCSGDQNALREAVELLRLFAEQWPALFAQDLAKWEQKMA
ncbi:hypothetical protein C8J56DRAFT_366886 [Mycena floridula]|nr:hypothetical protein C8J56DRAFT_366886 [Mycena floridula]